MDFLVFRTGTVFMWFCCYFSNSVSRSQSRSPTRKQRSRSRSPVRGESGRHGSKSRGSAKRRSGSPPESRASKKGNCTPANGSPQRNSASHRRMRKDSSRSATPVRKYAGHRSRSVSGSRSPSKGRHLPKGPHTPPDGSPQRQSQSPSSARRRDETRPMLDRGDGPVERSPENSRRSHSPAKNSLSSQEVGRKGPHTPPSPSVAKQISSSSGHGGP